MWHVAEGDLHAYLDGALGAYPVAEADRIREHLEQCEECRRRLREEEGVRERAGSVLARTDLGTLEPPPFEEIRQRARVRVGQGEASRPGRLGMRFGWAASVALALGTGWMLGHGGGTVAPGPLAEPTATPETFAANDEGSVASSADALGRFRDSLQPARLAQEERQDAAERAIADDPPVPAEAEELAGAPLPPAGAAETAEVALGAPTPGDARIGLGSNTVAALREERDVDEVPDSALPTNMLVPGLPVVQVRWIQLTPGVDGLVVQQRLVQDTTTLELRFLGLDRDVPLPEGEPSSLFGALPEGVNQVVVPLDEKTGWVALRGRLPRERLERLLDLLR